jgi:hypothetical protein
MEKVMYMKLYGCKVQLVDYSKLALCCIVYEMCFSIKDCSGLLLL